MKKALVILLTVLMILLLAACGANEPATEEPAGEEEAAVSEDGWPVIPAGGPSVNIICGYSGDSTLPHGYSAETFKAIVEERSNGKITVTNYENNSLGDDITTTESVQAGDVTMCITVTSLLTSFVPEMAVFDMPMLLTSVEKAFEGLNAENSKVKAMLNSAMQKNGMYLLGALPTSFREMTCTKAIESMDNFNSVRIRTQDNKYHRAFWTSLGASPTTIAYTELYMALEQGVVNAQENPFSTIIQGKFYEVQDYVVKTDHIMFTLMYFVNNDWFQNLPAAYQECIQMAMNETLKPSFAFAQEVEAKSIATLEDYGVTVIYPEKAMIAAMQEKAKPAWDLVREDLGNEICDAMIAEFVEN